ncbi:MAG: DUF2177 family protein [Caulobacteraceae bacterium]
MIGRWLAAYVGAGLTLAGLDALWLTATSERLYRPALHSVLINGFRPLPAILFYLVYLVGVVVFAVAPAVRAGSWRKAALMGALFGFFAYATYDLTNQATLIVWATRITLLDLTWGTVLTASGATAGYFASTLVGRR